MLAKQQRWGSKEEQSGQGQLPVTYERLGGQPRRKGHDCGAEHARDELPDMTSSECFHTQS